VSGEPFPHNPRYSEQNDDIGGDRPQADIEGTERRQEGHRGVDDMHTLRQDLGHDVDDQERERAEGRGPVSRLHEDPVTGVQDHPVGGDESESDRRAQRDQREYAGVEEHEVLDSQVKHVTGTGQGQERDDDGRSGDRHAEYLARVLGNGPAGRRASALTAAGTAAGTAASRSHVSTSSSVGADNPACATRRVPAMRAQGACQSVVRL
jgi:hypothetical protein